MTIDTADIVLISVVFTIATLYLLSRRLLARQQIVLQEVARDDASPVEDDCEAELVESDEANDVWQDAVNELLLGETSEGQLIIEYRKTLLAMWDKVDPYYAKELANELLSEVLRIGNRSRCYSFRRFVKSLGK